MLLLHPPSPYRYLILEAWPAIVTMWFVDENIVEFASCRLYGAAIDTDSLLDALVLRYMRLPTSIMRLNAPIIVWLETENTIMRVYCACLDFTTTPSINRSSNHK